MFVRFPAKVMGLYAKDNALPLPTIKLPLTRNEAVTEELLIVQFTVPAPVAPTDKLPSIVHIPVPVAATAASKSQKCFQLHNCQMF